MLPSACDLHLLILNIQIFFLFTWYILPSELWIYYCCPFVVILLKEHDHMHYNPKTTSLSCVVWIKAVSCWKLGLTSDKIVSYQIKQFQIHK